MADKIIYLAKINNSFSLIDYVTKNHNLDNLIFKIVSCLYEGQS